MERLELREALARVKTLGDVVTGAGPKFLGPQILITGDGRRRWGPPA
jgi:SanA protein